MFADGESAALHTVPASDNVRIGSDSTADASCHTSAIRSEVSGTIAGTGTPEVVLSWDTLGTSVLPEGHQLGEAVLLFSKIEDAVVEAQVAKLEAAKKARQAAAARSKGPHATVGENRSGHVRHLTAESRVSGDARPYDGNQYHVYVRAFAR